MVFDNLCMLWMCIWMSPNHVTDAPVWQAFSPYHVTAAPVWRKAFGNFSESCLCWPCVVVVDAIKTPSKELQYQCPTNTKCVTTFIGCGRAYGWVLTMIELLLSSMLLLGCAFCRNSAGFLRKWDKCHRPTRNGPGSSSGMCYNTILDIPVRSGWYLSNRFLHVEKACTYSK